MLGEDHVEQLQLSAFPPFGVSSVQWPTASGLELGDLSYLGRDTHAHGMSDDGHW